jgi:tetratricopeptide (TPR) repeat protein
VDVVHAGGSREKADRAAWPSFARPSHRGETILKERVSACRLKDATAHYNLGLALYAKEEREEATKEYRTAIALDPKDAKVHNNLAVVLTDKGEREEAIKEYRTAIQLDPTLAQAYGALGLVLLQQGQLLEARKATQRCLQLLTSGNPQRQLAQRQLRRCESLLVLDQKLPAILKGEVQPPNVAEQFGLAILCVAKNFYAGAARFYADALATEPKLTNNPAAGHRYNTANAARAAASQGEDAGKLDDKERARLRKQALGWLRADLDLWAKQVENGKPPVRAAARQTLQHWQKDTDLEGLRDAAALPNLPAAKRADYQKLWADAAALLKKCNPKDKP